MRKLVLYGLFAVVLLVILCKDFMALERMNALFIQAPSQTANDYASYYVASQLAEEGQSPYDMARLDIRKHEAAQFDSQPLAPYIYPPVSLILFKPLAGLSYLDGFVTYAIAGAIMLLITTWLVYCILLRQTMGNQKTLLSLAFLFFLHPVAISNVLAVQANGIVVFLVAAAILFSTQSSSFTIALAGACIVVAGGTKLYPFLALPFLWLAASNRTAFFWGALGAVIILLIINFSYYPLHFTKDYIVEMQGAGAYFDKHFNIMNSARRHNWSINGLMAGLAAELSGSPEPAAIRARFLYPLCIGAVVLLALTGIVATATGLMVWAKNPSVRIHWRWSLIAILYYQLVSPMVWSVQTIVIDPLLFTLVWCAFNAEKNSWSAYGWIFAIAFYISTAFINLAEPVASLFPVSIAPYLSVCIYNYPTFFLTALFCSEAYRVIIANVTALRNAPLNKSSMYMPETSTGLT